MTILVLAEHDNNHLKPETAKLVTAASQLDSDIHLLVVGSDCRQVAKQAQNISGVVKVLLADNSVYEAQLAENVAKLTLELASDYQYFLAASSAVGKDIMPRVAALLDVGQVSDVIAVVSDDTFVRPIYAGNALATVKTLDDKVVLTVRTSAFDAASEEGHAALEEVNIVIPAKTVFVSQTLTQSERPDLTSAAVVVAGGRGLGNGENFALLDALADKLGAAIGASRAAVDAGYVPNDLQVGQTGKIVAPDLYIAVGISGAIQHLAGMKDSKVIVAINKDADAPIFEIADYGLQADLFEAVPDLTKLL